MNNQIENKETSLFTTVHPNNGKETVILLHGGPGVPDGLTFLKEYLAKNFQVIHFHQRGTQKSPNPNHYYSLDAYISDINRIAEYFKLSKFHLFGHSWGGLYAQIYEIKYREKLLSLFLCSPASGTGRQWRETMVEIAHYNKSKCSLSEYMAMVANSTLGLLGSDTGYQQFYSKALRNFSRGFQESHPELFALDCIKAKAINQTVKTILTSPLLPEVSDPDCRTTLVYGDQDILGDSKKYVLQRYPRATTAFISGSGHLPWSHNKKEFVKVLQQHYQL